MSKQTRNRLLELPQVDYSGSINSQLDLLSQPTAADAIASSARDASNLSSVGPRQRAVNRGLAAYSGGAQAYSNQQRQNEISPQIELAGAISTLDAMLKTENQKNQQRVLTGINFARENYGLLKNLGEASTQNSVAANKIAEVVGRNYQQAFGLDLGDYAGYDAESREISYRDQEGIKHSYPIGPAVGEFLYSAYGDQAKDVLIKLDPYYQEKYSREDEAYNLAIQGEQAKINAQNAHTGLYNEQVYSSQFERSPEYLEMKSRDPKKIEKIAAEIHDIDETVYTIDDAIEYHTESMRLGSGQRGMLGSAVDRAGNLLWRPKGAETVGYDERQLTMDKKLADIKNKEAKAIGATTDKQFDNVKLPTIRDNDAGILEALKEKKKVLLEKKNRLTNEYNFSTNQSITPSHQQFQDRLMNTDFSNVPSKEDQNSLNYLDNEIFKKESR